MGLDIKDIKGPEDNKNYYHTDNLGEIWVDGKGHPIELTIPLQGQQVQSVSPETLWHGRQTRHMTHTDAITPTIPMSATNSTMVNSGGPNTVGNIPVFPIIERQIGDTTVDITDERCLFNVHSGIIQTALKTAQNRINDPQTHPSQVQEATKFMNDMQGQISHDLIPILEESPKNDQTEESENSKPEDLASPNGHIKELAEKDRLIQEGRQQVMLEMSQIAQNLQDHVQMQMQNLHQSYDKRFNHCHLTVIGKSKICKANMIGTHRTKKNNYSLRNNFMKPRDIVITIVQGIHQCQTYLNLHIYSFITHLFRIFLLCSSLTMLSWNCPIQ